MNKRNNITITLNGPARLYYAHMVGDVKSAIRHSIRESGGTMPLLTDSCVLKHIIADYFILTYGQEERKKIRNTFHARYHKEVEQKIEQNLQRYASG